MKIVSRRRFLQAASVATMAPMAGSLAASGAGAATKVSDDGQRADDRAVRGTLLLVDDHHILYRSGTKRVLRPLQRHPKNPLIVGKDKPWEVAIAWSSVHRQSKTGLYQLWYQSFAGDAAREKTHRCTVAYAESDDGIAWRKPALGLYHFNDVRDTNIVLLANGGRSDRYGVSVVVDDREADPARRYKMTYFDFSLDQGKEFPGMCVAFSPDGIHWTKHAPAPVLRASYGDRGEEVPFANDASRLWSVPLSIADASDVFFDAPRSVFAVYGKMWIDGPDGRMYWKHAACRTQSADFVHWDPPQLVMTPDELDPPYVEFHTTPVFFYNGCYFAAPQILNRHERGGIMDIELAFSRDGLKFDRPFRKPFWLPRSAEGAFDSGSLFTNSSPVFLEDEMRFYYGGYSQGATGGDDKALTTGIGLATLPLDRFVSLEPIEDIAQVTLKPIHLHGVRSITLNADAKNGGIRPELLDAAGYRVRGFTRDDAIAIVGDSLRHSVQWKGKSLDTLVPGAYMLRLLMKSAHVFAVTVNA